MATKAKMGTQRKLTAIVSADVAGYSRLMGADEEAAIETLTSCRKESCIRPRNVADFPRNIVESWPSRCRGGFPMKR